MKKTRYTEKRMLNVPLSEGERLEYGEALARAETAKDEAEATKKTTGAQLGADIKARAAEVQRLAAIVNGKSKTAEVECAWTLSSPKKGKKVLVRQDSMQVIETRDMDDQDQQELFPEVVADLEKKPKPGDDARDVTPPLGLPAPGESTAGAKKGKGKKPKKVKPSESTADMWAKVKEHYLKARQSDPKNALAFTVAAFSGVNKNTLKARIRREKWNEQRPAAE